MKIGKYQVLGLLGRGGMSAVYKVLQPVTGRICALKLLAPNPILLSLLGKRAIERQFAAEAQALGRLDHPNLVAIWDFARTRRGPYFLMEHYCRNLAQIIGETRWAEAPTRPMSLPRAGEIVLQTLAGLARLHAAGVVHRDVKPANLLLDGQGQVKITDLGLSNLRGEHLPQRPGLKVGSPYYAAPEQEQTPNKAGPPADLYSVGVSLYRLLLGQAPQWPFKGDNRVSQRHADLDQAWDDFFNRVLSPHPGERPATVRDMAQELNGLLEDWHKRVDRVCQEFSPREGPSVGPVTSLRAQPVKIGLGQAREFFGLDELWRPKQPANPRFELQGPAVADRNTGLVWQKGGGDYPLTWDQAQDYPGQLNAQGFARATNWRLPTVSELLSLLTPPPRFTGHCLAPDFDPGQSPLWSADRQSFTQAWCADADMGTVNRADMTCRLWVKAVRSGPG